MELTKEQQKILDHIKSLSPESDAKDKLILVSSVAGSGKTSLLKAIASEVPHTNGLMIAYNKSIATASTKKFPSTTKCLTTHSLAYRATVKPYSLKIGYFSYRDITDKIPYNQKCAVVDYLREFCLSEYLTFDEFAETIAIDQALIPLVNKYLSLMESGKIDVTHDFYLKMFHILLANGDITYPEFDFIFLDEAGDVNPVTSAIFELLPAKFRVAVGDPHQNIYSFNHTINCFKTLAPKGVTFNLSQSFRVPDIIATQVEAFCKAYLDKNMTFKGVPLTDTTIKTRAYIARTNSSLIAHMIRLNKEGTPYNLIRKASEIFRLPIMVTKFKKDSYISDPQYSHLQKDIDEWYTTPFLQEQFKTVFAYLIDLYGDDIVLVSAIRVVSQHGRQTIMDAYFKAKELEGTKYNYTLTTAHSSKGLQFDEVTLADDMNTSIREITQFLDANPDTEPLPEQREALNLYYVAITRALKFLNNATILNNFQEELRKLQKESYPEQLI